MTATSWALLIGVQHYPGLYDFQGCFNDVKSMSSLLQEKYGFQRRNMAEMTDRSINDHSQPADLGGLLVDLVPTYDNIFKAWATILEHGRPGDLVYVHFSGMSVTADSILPKYATLPYYRDMVLLPAGAFGDSTEPQKLLHDVEISAMMHRMCTKGMEATLIIDGRHPYALIRQTLPVRSRTSYFGPEELEKMSQGKWQPQGSADTWITDPDPDASFTMLTSFGLTVVPPQSKSESGSLIYECMDDAGGKTHGFLTAWLHRALRQASNPLNFKQLARALEAARSSSRDKNLAFHSSTPVRGDAWRMFPGNAVIDTPSLCALWPIGPDDNESDTGLRAAVFGQTIQASENALFSHSATTFSRHILIYRRFLKAQSPWPQLNDLIDLSILGGYRVHQPTPATVYPDYDKQGVFHVLTGDYIKFSISSNKDNEPLYLSVVSFDSDFGVKVLYPGPDDAEVQRVFLNFTLTFRLGLPKTALTDGAAHIRRPVVLKVFLSAQRLYLDSMEMPGITDSHFLAQNDALRSHAVPIVPISTQGGQQSRLSSTVATSRPKNGLSSEDKVAEAWHAENLTFMVHQTSRSLESGLDDTVGSEM